MSDLNFILNNKTWQVRDEVKFLGLTLDTKILFY